MASGVQVTQTFSGIPLQTGGGAGAGTTKASLTGAATPTFNLGGGSHPTATTAAASGSSATSSSGGSKNAAGALCAPALETSILASAVVGLLGAAIGGAWFLL